MKFFDGIETIEELKKEYRKLVKVHHPDCGGDTEIMKELNAAYESIYEKLENSTYYANDFEEKKERRKATSEEIKAFMHIIQSLAKYKNIEIEICGTWLWVSGDTKIIKNDLKNMGLNWARKKQMWYWHEGEYKRYGKKEYSMNDIRAKYGSKNVDTEKKNKRTIEAS